MMDKRTSTVYPVRPLRMRGVFAISWRLYAVRPFGPIWYTLWTLGLTVMCCQLGMALMSMALLEPERLMAVPGGLRADLFAALGATVALAGAVFTVFWVWPTVSATLHREMLLRMQGRPQKVKTLFANGKYLRRAQYGAHMALLIVAFIGVLAAAGVVAAFAANKNPTGVYLSLVGWLTVLTVFLLCMQLLFPVASNEYNRGFSAVGRAFRLGFFRLLRLMGAFLMGAAVTAAFMALCYGICRVYLPGDPLLAHGAAGLGCTLIFSIAYPYFAALNTVLYFDALARERVRNAAMQTGTPPLASPKAAGHPAARAGQIQGSDPKFMIKENQHPMNQARASVDPSLRWRLEDIYGDDSLWEQDFVKAQESIAAFTGHSGKLTQSADSLYGALAQRSENQQLLERLFTYAKMRRDEDNGNTLYQGMTDRAMQLAVSAEACASFVVPEILTIPSETLHEWMKEPRFSPFRFELEDLDRQRAHRLSSAEERILALAEEPLSGSDTIYTMLVDVDMEFGQVTDEKGESVKLTHGTYGLLLNNPDRRVRQEAYQKLYAAYGSMSNTITATYATSVKSDIFRAKARGFDGAVESALFDGNVPLAVYEQLIQAVHEKLPAMSRYMELKKKQLGVDQLEMYDLYVPIVPDCDIPMTYEEAKKVVKTALSPLGENYAKLLDRAYSENWIDVMETPGKTSGAYSWGVYGTHPYVLLNHQDNVDHAFTLAHELGHAMHSYHSDAALPYELAQYRIMVAEVASTVNEVLMMQYLLKNETDPKKKAYLLNQFLEQFRTTCFRQTMFAEFELKAHRMAEKGEPLTTETLNGIYRELNQQYYPGTNVDDNIAIEWMRIPHFYRAFYVYQYATGICTAVALADGILKHGALDSYIAFLSSGGSDYPIELLKHAGVDLTDKQSILTALDVFEDSLSQLEELLK